MVVPDVAPPPRRVLIVDPHEGSRTVLFYALRSRGHTCIAVSAIDAALALIPVFQPEVIAYEWLVDRRQRLGNGPRLRAAAARVGRVLRVLAMSVIEEPDGFSVAEGVDGYMVKPINLVVFEQLMTFNAP